MERGVIITPNFTFDGRSLHFPGLVGIEQTSLRHYLLYWDKIEYPNNNIIHIATSPDEQFLIEKGVLSRTDFTFSGFSGNIGFAYLYMQAAALEIKNQKQPGQWSLAQPSAKVYIPQDLAAEARTIEVELYRALPTPGENVSLDDILNFKQKRRSELQAFRTVMDELYVEIADSSDIPRAKSATLLRLEKAIHDLHEAADESWINKLISSMKVELNLPSIATQALAGAGLATAFGVSPDLGAAIGAVGAALKFEFLTQFKSKKLPEELRDYAYLHHIERELKT